MDLLSAGDGALGRTDPKGTQPIRSMDDLAADTFESDEELAEFLAFTHAERHRDVM
jgi:hypothetical protein